MARRRKASGNDRETRNLLAKLASKRSTRMSGPTQGRPADWNPGDVRDPEDDILGGYFTDDSAWNLIATKLREGHPLETTDLRNPVGATGYVLKVEIERGSPRLYIKVELSRNRRLIFGRSFHYTLYD